MPPAVLFTLLGTLHREDIVSTLVAVPRAAAKMKSNYGYDSKLSVLSIEGKFISVDELVLPPVGINLFHLYVCYSTLKKINDISTQAKPEYGLNLQVKLCISVRDLCF